MVELTSSVTSNILRTMPKAQGTQGLSALTKVIAFQSDYKLIKIQPKNFGPNFSLKVLTKLQLQHYDQNSLLKSLTNFSHHGHTVLDVYKVASQILD